MQTSYEQRDKCIQHCLNVVNEDVKKLNAKRLEDPDNVQVLKALRKEQTKVGQGLTIQFI